MDNLLLLIPVAVVVVAWALNEFSRRRWETYKRKEDRYTKLLCNMSGFYVQPNSDKDELQELRSAFIEQLGYGWLYLPDELIRKGYEFLDAVRFGADSSDRDKEILLGEFVALMRKDLYGKRLLLWTATELEGKDFRHLKSN